MKNGKLSLLFSAYTMVAFHVPFFKDVAANISPNFNGILIFVSMMIIMLALNFVISYILLYCFRTVGKCILAFLTVGNSICLYFVNTYNVLIDRDMMGNVFNTQFSEASSFWSWGAVGYIVLLGILPSILLFIRKTDYGSFKRFAATVGISLGVIIGVVGCNMKNFTWIDSQAPLLGSRLMPWSYIINSVRYYNYWKTVNQKEIQLPDAKYEPGNEVCILVIGESARAANFSLYGYQRQTNPLMTADSVSVIDANASDTYTTAAVKAILQHKKSRDLYEILPNYLYRNGVDVIWRTSNWGTPPINVPKKHTKKQLKELYPGFEGDYDGLLLEGLKEEIASNDSTRIFVGLHTYTSHGPSYFSNTPEEFKTFTPECRTVEMSQADTQELINAYDNTIIYTDYLVHSLIEMLRSMPGRRSCVIFISDHGESLGENNLYMHGVPLSMAPEEQIKIPFIVWTSDRTMKIKEMDSAGHYNIYHSVLRFLNLNSPVYDATKDIFQ